VPIRDNVRVRPKIPSDVDVNDDVSELIDDSDDVESDGSMWPCYKTCFSSAQIVEQNELDC